MRSLRLLLLVVGMSVCLTVPTLAMGSGPHPHVPYGIPVPAKHGAASAAQIPSMTTLMLSAASVIGGGIFLFAIQPYVRRP